jgi:hypothetical protein
MVPRGLLATTLTATCLVTPCVADARRTPSHAQPRAFASCAGLVDYARRHFAVTDGVAAPAVRPLVPPGPTGIGVSQDGSMPPAVVPAQSTAGSAPSFSTTNAQEPGVDEPDLVKTDGSTIFAVSGTTLHAVAVDAGTPRLAGSLPLPSPSGAQLLLRGSRLIVISAESTGVPVPAGVPSVAPSIAVGGGGRTLITEIDVHDPAAMRITRTMAVDGTYVDARQNGATARVVISSSPRAVADASVRGAPAGWVPRRRFRSRLTTRRYVRPVAACSAIDRPAQFSGLGMLTILTINLDHGLYQADADALMGDAQVVYGSPRSLYVATQRWVDPSTPVDRLPSTQTTAIQRFDASDPDRTTLVASGEVPGYLLNQFSLSEDQGRLRVATTSRPIWWNGVQAPPASQSSVTVLADQDGALTPVGSVSGLGAGQQIYSVRFLADKAYVVTFRRIDPLYVVDLSTPTRPKVAGELELEGYSSYLHPVGDGLLLGIGTDVNASSNQALGTQIELFDVGDPGAPRLVRKVGLGRGSSSQVQYDHHALLFWAPTGLAVLPIQDPGSSPAFAGAIGYRVDRSGIAEVGRVAHDAVNGFVPAVARSLVIGDRLFTLSSAGVMASGLDDLGRKAFVAFAQP